MKRRGARDAAIDSPLIDRPLNGCAILLPSLSSVRVRPRPSAVLPLSSPPLRRNVDLHNLFSLSVRPSVCLSV